MARNQFFRKVEDNWSDTKHLRASFSRGVPAHINQYFKEITSIDQLAILLVNPIGKPLWFTFNALGQLLKCLITATAAALIAPLAIVSNILAPRSEFTGSLNTAFSSAAAHAIVSAGISIIAALCAVAAVVLNPLCLVSDCLSTIYHRVTDPCTTSTVQVRW